MPNFYSPAAQLHHTLAGTHFPPAEGKRLSWPGLLCQAKAHATTVDNHTLSRWFMEDG